MADFSFDPTNPLAKMPGETQRANDALRDYYAMGPGRSIRGLLESYRRQTDLEPTAAIPTRRSKTLFNWSSQFSWSDRVEAQRGLDLEADKLIWEDRRRQTREADWRQGLALRSIADQIIAEGPNFIKTRRRVVKGRPRTLDTEGKVLDPGEADQVVVTMALDGSFMVKATTTGSELTRLAAELETSRELQTLAGSVSIAPEVDYGDLTDNQIARLAAESAAFLLALSSRVNSESQPGPGPESDTNPPDPGPADS